MAHRAAQATFDRHLPNWEQYQCPIIIVSPRDDLIETKYPIWAIGRKNHHGPESIARFREMLFRMYTENYARTMFFEYDAIGLSPTLPKSETAICGNVFRDDRPDRGFLGTTYIHPPILFPWDPLDRLIKVLPKYGDNLEHSFWDRWLGLICEVEDIPLMNLMPHYGHAANTIEAPMLPDAVAAAARGVSLFHGVKTPEVLNALTKAFVKR